MLKRAADLAEALYAMPRNGPVSGLVPGFAGSVPVSRSPATALNSAAAAAAMSAGLNAAYAAQAGQHHAHLNQLNHHSNLVSNSHPYQSLPELGQYRGDAQSMGSSSQFSSPGF